MSPYQVMGIIAGCTIVFAGVVTLLTMQGVHILLAFLGVYLVVVSIMLSMQRRARESYENREDFRFRRLSGDVPAHRSQQHDFQRPAESGANTAGELRV